MKFSISEYEVKQLMRNIPVCRIEVPEPLVCRKYERCRDCRFPAVGFNCDHGDGTCLRTDMFEKIKEDDEHNIQRGNK